MGWLERLTATNSVVVFGTGAGTGLFVYNGQPALGNPPIFYVTTASVDPFGNPVTPNEVNAATLSLLVSLIQAQSAIFNPGPVLLYGNPGATLTAFTSTGTFTPPSNGTVQVYFIGAGAAGAAGIAGGGGGESALDSDTVTGLAPYTITLDAVSTRATFNTKTVTAHSATGRVGATGSTNATHFNGGNGALTGVPAGGGAASSVGPGGNAAGNTPGHGGAAAFVYEAGGNGGVSGVAGSAPGGGGGGGAAGAAGYALIIFIPAGGSALLDSIAQAGGVDPIGGGTYVAGITNYNPTFGTYTSLQNGGLKGQAGGQTYNQRPSPSPLAFPIVDVTADGNTYDMTRLTVVATPPPVTFSSVGPADIPGLKLPVGIGTYEIVGQIVFEGIAAAAGNAKFSWSAASPPTASAIKLTGMFWQDTGGAISINGGVMNAVTDILTSQVLSITAEYVLTIRGWATFSAAGTLQLQAACSNAADTFQVRVNGTYLKLLPVVA
jgi:hypothetical protein